MNMILMNCVMFAYFQYSQTFHVLAILKGKLCFEITHITPLTSHHILQVFTARSVLFHQLIKL